MSEVSPVWVVRQRLAGDAARVRSALSDALADLPGEGTAGLTGLEWVATASLFLRPDALLLRLAVRPGLPGRVLVVLAGLIGRLRGGRIERLFGDLSEPVMEAEGMFTETLVLEDADDGRVLTRYMEFADLDAVYEAYYETSNPVARASESLLGWVLVDPAAALAPARDPEFELLAHAVSPDRS